MTATKGTEQGRRPGAVLVTGGASGLGAAVALAVQEAGGRPFVLDLATPPFDVEHELVDLADRRGRGRGRGRGRAPRPARRGGDRRRGRRLRPAGRRLGGGLGEWVAVNLLGTAAVVRAALPHLQRTGGRVVTVASTLGLRAPPDATAYCASKFGVVGFTRALAAETAGRVGVTLLLPGGMHTAFFDGRPEQYKPAPDAKLNRPEDVAQAVLFALCQPPAVRSGS